MARYGAFISYSRSDVAFARKLHAALESYRLPRNAGESQAVEKPDRIAPLFRDQDEVSASSNLGDTLRAALADSFALIVIASTDAANSRWVNAEIEEFARLGRAGRIFVAIPPYISGERGFPLNSIFPPALMSLGEPLAADFRPHCDGWTLGKLKLVAGVAGVDLVRLRDRDAARRLRRTAVASVAGLAIVGVLGATGLNWWQAEQRARNERVERSLEAVRANLSSDQVGVGLAYVESLRSVGVSDETAAALDRVRLFWNDQLESPADSIAAIPVGATYSVNDVLYYRSESGPMRMPVTGADTVYQREGLDHLYMAGDDGVLHRVNAATGETSIPPGQREGGYVPDELYELPNGVLIMTAVTGPGASMAGSRERAHVSYPSGGRSGFVRMGVHLHLHANDSCTRLYFVDGAEGYGATSEVIESNPDFVQLIYEDRSIFESEPYRLGVVTLDPQGDPNWREGALAPGSVSRDTQEPFTEDWLAAHGAPLNEVCARYRLEASYIRGDAREVRLPSISTRAWRHDPSIAQGAVWRQVGGWFNGASEEAFDVPGIFWQSEDGRFAVYERFGAYQGATYTFCSHPQNGSARCITREGESEGELSYLPQAGVVSTVEGLMDMRTLRVTPWPHAGLSEAPGGRTLMTYANGAISAHAYAQGAAPTLTHSFTDPEIAELVAVRALNAEEALAVTREGRLMRINVAERRIEWSERDRAAADFLAGKDYFGPTELVQLAASPDGRIGVLLLLGSVRLYELTLGMPLTPSVPLEDIGVRELRRAIVSVSNEGEVRISGAGEGQGLVRPAPQPRPAPADSACFYGARVVDGQAQPVDILGNPEMMRRCGFTNATPSQQ